MIKPQGLQGASLSKLQEVTAAIDAFKESGKPVIAMADYYSQGPICSPPTPTTCCSTRVVPC